MFFKKKTYEDDFDPDEVFRMLHSEDVTAQEQESRSRIPEGTKRLDEKQYAWYQDDITEIEIPQSLEEIPGNTAWPRSLERFSVHPDNRHFCTVDGALYRIDGGHLTLIAVPARTIVFSVPGGVVIPAGIFKKCPRLAYIHVETERYSSKDGFLLSDDGTTILAMPPAHPDREVSIKKFGSVTRIGLHAFAGVHRVDVTIDCPVELEPKAFKGMSGTVTIEDGTIHQTLHKGYFDMNVHLKSSDSEKNARLSIVAGQVLGGRYRMVKDRIDIPEGVKAICQRAFRGYSMVKSVTFPKTLLRIEKSAFEGCLSLTKLDIPENVMSIDANAFKDCSGLKEVVIHGFPMLGEDVFAGCGDVTVYCKPQLHSVLEKTDGVHCQDLPQKKTSRMPFIKCARGKWKGKLHEKKHRS